VFLSSFSSDITPNDIHVFSAKTWGRSTTNRGGFGSLGELAELHED
jgi:hypothetical protein